MATNITKQTINVGGQSNDGTGDSIRDAFAKTNSNFDTLFAVAGIGTGLAFTKLQDAPKVLTAQRVLVTDAGGLTLTQLALVGADGIQITFDYANKELIFDNTVTNLISDPAPKIKAGTNLDGQGLARAIRFVDPQRDQDLVTRKWVEDNFLNRDAEYAYDTGAGQSVTTSTILEGSTLRHNVQLAPIAVQTATNVGKIITTNLNFGTTATLNLAYQAWKNEHLTRKDYVDTKISLQGVSTIDSRTGQVNPGMGQMTGRLELFRDPIETDPDNTAATKHYVDNTGPLSITNFYVATNGNDNRIDIPPYKKGRSLAWAFRTIMKAAQAAEHFQKASQIELGPYQKAITTNNFTDPVSIVELTGSNIPNAVGIVVNYDGTSGTDAFINSSIYPGMYLLGVSDGAIGKIVNVTSGLTGSELYEVVLVDYAETFVSSITPDKLSGVVRFTFANANLIAIPDFWKGGEGALGYILRIDNTSGGGEGHIVGHGVTYDATGNVFDYIDVLMDVTPLTQLSTIPGTDWHVYSGDFHLGEQLRYGQNYNKTEISILVESGEYDENLPIRIADNCSIRGDEFRRSMIKPAVWPGTARATRSTSPWVGVYFRRDTQIDGMICVQYDTSTNYAFYGTPITPSGVTNDPLTGVVSFILTDSSPAPRDWIGKVFIGGGGIGEVVSVQGSVFNVNLAENELGVRALNSSTTISSGSYSVEFNHGWAIYSPYNFGYHYLQDASRPLNLLGWESSNNPGGYRKAAATLLKNKEFIKEEIIRYIDDTYPEPFYYDHVLCKRDVGFWVEGIAYDLLYGDVNRTINLADAYLDPSTAIVYNTELTQLKDSIRYFGVIGAQIISNSTVTAYQSTVTQVFSSVSLESEAPSMLSSMVTTINQIIDKDPAYNPGKRNDELDVFLMNDATMIRYLAGQGHGGFMKVLDPEGQIKAKSPYTQTASSFSQSIGRHRFAGGFFVDGFTGNLIHNTTQEYADSNDNGDFTSIPVESYGLTIRLPQTPCFFIDNGIRYQVDYISNWNKTDGTATLNLDPNKYGGIQSIGIASGTTNGWQPNRTANNNNQIPVTISSPLTPGGIKAKAIATTNGSGNITDIIVMYSGVGYRRPTDPDYLASRDQIVLVIGAALFTVTIGAGGTLKIVLSSGGVGYTTSTPVNVGAPPAGGTQATITITSVDTNGTITGFTYTGGSKYAAIPSITFGNANLVFNYSIKKGYIGKLSPTIETVTAGNRSMLANDFTQLNDFGYGIFATNGAFIENVSMFSYYCYTSYYCLNGSQVRTITGSSAYGTYGLVSEGSDPTEVPLAVTLPDQLTQILTVYNTAPYTNVAAGTNIYVDIGNNSIPYDAGEIEINHNGLRKKYAIKNATLTTGTVYSIALDTSGGAAGLYAQVPDGVKIINRVKYQFSLNGITAATITRPSTVLTLSEDPTNVYRMLSYTDLGNDRVLAEADAPYDYIIIQPYTQGGQYRQGIVNPVISNGGAGYTSSTYNLTIGSPTTRTAAVNGNQGTVAAPVTEITVNGASGTIHVGTSVSGTNVSAGTYVTYANATNTIIQLNQSQVLTGGTVLTFTGVTATAYANTNLKSITEVVITDPGVGYDTAPSVTPPTTTSTAVISVDLSGVVGSNYIKINPLSAQSIARNQASTTTDYSYQIGYGDKVFNLAGYTPATATKPWADLQIRQIGNTAGLTQEMMVDALYAGVSSNTTGTITVRISTLRATSHDMVDIGTGGYSSSKIPNDLYGPPLNKPNPSNETKEIGKGRVYFVTSDQDGNFRVGKYFSVDQGRGTVTISAPISLSGIDSLSFRKGVTVNEFSSDDNMAAESQNKIPVESTVVHYVNARLGVDKNGAIWPNAIGPGFLPLTGSSLAGGQPQMRGTINMGGNQINSLASPTAGSDAANKSYADTKVSLAGMSAALTVGGQNAGIMTGPLTMYSDPVKTTQTVASTGTVGASGLTLAGNAGVYIGMQINSSYVTTGSIITVVNGPIISFTGQILTQIPPGTNIVLDPVLQPATKRYVDSISQVAQLRDVALSNPTNQDLLMFSNVTLQPQTFSSPLYNTATQIVNVSLLGTAITNTPSANGGGSDVYLTRTGNSLTIKLVGGQGAGNPITNYHVNDNAAIAQSKLAMSNAQLVSSASTSSIIQSQKGLAAFNPDTFTIPGSLGWVDLRDAADSSTGVKASMMSHLSAANGGLLGNTVAGAASYQTSATIVSWLNTAPLSGGTFSGTYNTRSLVPAITNTYPLGGTSFRWSKIWATDADLNGAVTVGALTVTGNFTVQGSSVTVQSTQTAYTSPVLDISAPVGGGNITSDDGLDKGLNIHYYSGGSSHAFIGREDSSGLLVYKTNASPATEPAANPFLGSYGGAKFGTLILSGGNAATGYNNNTGDLQVSGGIGVGGAIRGNTVYDQNNRVLTGLTEGTGVTISGSAPNLTVAIGQSVATSATPTFAGMITSSNVRPDTNGSYSLGTSNYYYDSIYVNNLRGGGTVWGTWTLGSGATLQATYADLAERYRSDNQYEPGTIVVFGGNAEVTISTKMNDRKVAGVITTAPAYLMNAGIDGVDVALQGRVPCKVIGKIEKGDLIVSSGIAGVAMANNDPKMGTVIGKALQNYDSDIVGIIEVAVGRL